MTDEIIIYNTDDGKADVKLYSKDGIIWVNQQQMALLFDTSKQNISLHILNILQEKELDEKSVVKDYLTTAADGKNYSVTYYALPMVLAVGFRVRSVEVRSLENGQIPILLNIYRKALFLMMSV